VGAHGTSKTVEPNNGNQRRNAIRNGDAEVS
jgi:hypothetical protein